jgi:dihydrofolate synthase / folylpolyglutamate synthase
LNYQETLDYLYAQLPMFQRVGAQAYKPSLDNTIALCNAIGNPQHQFKSVHIAGTNGKGSSSHLTASVLQESNYKVGLYTSPHLLDFRERIKINGEMIPKDGVVSFVSENISIIEKIQPSFFELCVAMAFDYFAKQKVDIAVIEVGMGGRLDSTNIIHPEACLITNISFDHMQFLGDTLEKIAAEKAGIIKPNTPVVISEEQEACKKVFENKAKECNAELYFAEREMKLHYLPESDLSYSYFALDSTILKASQVVCSLPGIYQEKNIKGVLKLVEILQSKDFSISEDQILSGIKNVKTNTGLRGRWELLNKEPLAIADTGHNEDGIKQILLQLEKQNYRQLHWVWGMVNDKSPDKVFRLLPKTAQYYFCKPNIPRGLDAEECRILAKNHDLIGNSYDSVKLAYAKALENAHNKDLILVAGSTFVVAEVL